VTDEVAKAKNGIEEPTKVEHKVEETIEDPEPEAPTDDFGWRAFGSKKDKKKKGKSAVEEITKVEETPVPEPEPEFIDDDFGWGTAVTSKKDKKKGKNAIEPVKVRNLAVNALVSSSLVRLHVHESPMCLA
jgi:hypothetical protein